MARLNPITRPVALFVALSLLAPICMGVEQILSSGETLKFGTYLAGEVNMVMMENCNLVMAEHNRIFWSTNTAGKGKAAAAAAASWRATGLWLCTPQKREWFGPPAPKDPKEFMRWSSAVDRDDVVYGPVHRTTNNGP